MPRVLALFLLLSQKGSSPFAHGAHLFTGSRSQILPIHAHSSSPYLAETQVTTPLSFNRCICLDQLGTMPGIKADRGVGILGETEATPSLTRTGMHTNQPKFCRSRGDEMRILRSFGGWGAGSFLRLGNSVPAF